MLRVTSVAIGRIYGMHAMQHKNPPLIISKGSPFGRSQSQVTAEQKTGTEPSASEATCLRLTFKKFIRLIFIGIFSMLMSRIQEGFP